MVWLERRLQTDIHPFISLNRLQLYHTVPSMSLLDMWKSPFGIRRRDSDRLSIGYHLWISKNTTIVTSIDLLLYSLNLVRYINTRWEFGKNVRLRVDSNPDRYPYRDPFGFPALYATCVYRMSLREDVCNLLITIWICSDIWYNLLVRILQTRIDKHINHCIQKSILSGQNKTTVSLWQIVYTEILIECSSDTYFESKRVSQSVR